MIKNIVLDMGNVLLDYNPWYALDRFCSSRAEQETILRELFEGPEWSMADRGLIRDCERYERVRERVPERWWPSLKKCAERWAECMLPLKGAQKFVADCKRAGYNVYLLSNASDLFFTYFNHFGPLEMFDGAVISCREKRLKPEPEIYQCLFTRYHLRPEECFFIDDRAENVAAGEALGMTGYVFREDYPAIRSILGLEA